MVKGNTRFHANSNPSLIDHVYTNEPAKVEVENVRYGTSDHNLIGIRRKNGATVTRPRMMLKRVFKNFKLTNFLRDISEEDWEQITQIEDLDDCVEEFERKFVSILDQHCPVKRIQIRKHYTPWLDNRIKMKQAELSITKKVAERSGAVDDQRRVHRTSKEVKRMLKDAENKWMTDQANKHESDPIMSW